MKRLRGRLAGSKAPVAALACLALVAYWCPRAGAAEGPGSMPAYNAFALTGALPDAKLVLYGDAAHAFLFQHAADFSREVLEFLR